MDNKKKPGALWSVGCNSNGQLGIGALVKHVKDPRPVTATAKKKMVFVEANYNTSTALSGSGGIYVWGTEIGGVRPIYAPKKYAGLKGFNLISLGSEHAAALKSNGELYTWGSSVFGQLGLGENVQPSLPHKLDIKKQKGYHIACGTNHTLAVAQDNQIYVFGKLADGRLGLPVPEDNPDASQNTPKEATNTNFRDKVPKFVHCGEDFSVVLTATGELLTTGNSENGRNGLGRPSFVNVFTQLPFNKKVIMISCGPDHTAIVTDGQVFTYGYGGNGRLGHKTDKDEVTPREVEGLTGKGITWVACGGCHTTALTNRGEMYSWGWNHYGQLGYDGAEEQREPKLVPALNGKNVLMTACGYGHTLMLVAFS